jgi:hypothetical protein
MHVRGIMCYEREDKVEVSKGQKPTSRVGFRRDCWRDQVERT